MKDNIHIISTDIPDEDVLLHIPTNRIFSLSKISSKVIKRHIEGDSIENISCELNISLDTVSECINFINCLDQEIEDVQKKRINKYLSRITLHISNSCNMNCSYCYAGGGNYHTQPALMNVEESIKIIDYFLHEFDYIESIVFFGGEPLLNLKAISGICKYIDNLYRAGRLLVIPNYSIITNGTLLNKHIVKVIDTYNINITVSIDGPKKINDSNRRLKNGKGTYNNIERFIKGIKSSTSSQMQFEATYTEAHIKYGYSIDKIYRFMKSKFGLKGTVVPAQNYFSCSKYIGNMQYKKLFLQSIEKKIETCDKDIIMCNDYIKTILNCIANNCSNELCQIGAKMIAVSTDGKIYPCHILVGKENFCLGDVFGDNIFNKPSLFKYYSFFSKLKDKEFNSCNNCWIRNFCGGCALNGFYNTINNKFMNSPNNDFCKFQKDSFEKLILHYHGLMKDQSKSASFFNQLYGSESK